jgi:hypothetical protein
MPCNGRELSIKGMRIKMLKGRFLGLIPVFMLLMGCLVPRYEYIPPGTPEGLDCIKQCESMRSRCKIDEGLRADREQNRLEIAYEECMEWRISRGAKAFCRQEAVYPDYSECKRNYNLCFERCGGEVIKSEK